MPPIFTSTSFGAITRPSPVGVMNAPTGASDAVSLTLSDGSVVQIFDTLETALKCMEFMRQRDQWLLQVSDDVACVNAGPKLLLLEMPLTSQKLLASFSPSLAPVSIAADELTACLLHLMVNAGQAIPQPRADGRISVAGRACRGGMVLVQVVDNGIGMSPGTIRRAGVPGFTTRADGTGMGLRAVRDAIAKIGGVLTIDSTPGHGTKVELRLPVARDFRSLSA